MVSDGDMPVTGDAKDFGRAAIISGLASIEAIVSAYALPSSNLFAAGTDFPTIADICLVPQVYNARRFDVDLSQYPSIMSVISKLEALSAFIQAAPENQPDAVK
jgi:glutathione S-transferase